MLKVGRDESVWCGLLSKAVAEEDKSECVTSSNVLRKGSLQTKLNAGLSKQQQEDLFQNERSFHKVKL